MRMRYRYFTTAEKRIFWTTIGMWLGLLASLFAQVPGNPLTATRWYDLVTPANIITAVAAVYGAGVLREQFRDVRERIGKLEENFTTALDKDLPQTYVRRDVFEERMAAHNLRRPH